MPSHPQIARGSSAASLLVLASAPTIAEAFSGTTTLVSVTAVGIFSTFMNLFYQLHVKVIPGAGDAFADEAEQLIHASGVNVQYIIKCIGIVSLLIVALVGWKCVLGLQQRLYANEPLQATLETNVADEKQKLIDTQSERIKERFVSCLQDLDNNSLRVTKGGKVPVTSTAGTSIRNTKPSIGLDANLEGNKKRTSREIKPQTLPKGDEVTFKVGKEIQSTLIRAIQAAHTEIRIYTSKLSDPAILDALVSKARKGVSISICIGAAKEPFEMRTPAVHSAYRSYLLKGFHVFPAQCSVVIYLRLRSVSALGTTVGIDNSQYWTGGFVPSTEALAEEKESMATQCMDPVAVLKWIDHFAYLIEGSETLSLDQIKEIRRQQIESDVAEGPASNRRPSVMPKQAFDELSGRHQRISGQSSDFFVNSNGKGDPNYYIPDISDFQPGQYLTS